MERLVGGDGEFLARNLRHDGVAAGRDQDLLRGDRLLANLNGVAVHQPASTHVQLDARAFEQPDVDGVQAVDFGLDVVAQGRPRVRGFGQRPAIGRSVLELVRELGAIDQELLRHAAPDHAGAADPVVLADANARTMAGRDARSAHTARTGADDEKIVIIRHVDNLRTKPQHGHIPVAGQTISALRRPGKGNGTCISIS
jgi:glyoxylase-like metal-dependent hydrolase (beta-lactamase superfamily II)